jgi:chitodextrinase
MSARHLLLAAASVVLTGAWPASASASSSGQVSLNPTDFNQRVTVGHGFVEASARQVVRTSNDVVYIITADDSTDPASIHVWKGSPAGIPTTFTEMDAADRPTAYRIGSPDTRLDRNNVIQMAYSDETNHTLYYQTFDTKTDTWGTRRALAANAETGLADGSTLDRTGNVAIILDGNDNPGIAYTTTSNTVTYLPSDGSSGGFGPAETVARGTLPIHPALAMTSTGAVDLTWANNTAPLGCDTCSTNSPSSTIMFAQRSPSGVWSAPETVATEANSNVYLDQSPNIVTDSNDVPYVVYIDGDGDHVHVVHRASSGWIDDSPPPASYAGYVHDPTLYSAGTDIYLFPGHNGNINFGYQYELGGAGTQWSAFDVLDSTQNDGSASVRWDPMRDNDSRVIDTVYFNEDAPTTLFYMAIAPEGGGSGDATPPTVSITAHPTNPSASINPSFTFSGSDDVTPADQLSYQCSLDDAEPTNCSSPVTELNLRSGSHTFAVRATDQAGNVSVADVFSWVIDTTPPTAPGNLTAAAVSPTQVDLTWDAARDASGIVGYNISRDGEHLVTVGDVTSYRDATVAANTSYSYSVSAVDAAQNSGPASTPATVTTPASPPNSTPPSVPTGLYSTAVSTSSVSLAWTASTANPGGSGVAGYEIYRDGALVGRTTATTFTESGLAPGVKYFYTVAAIDDAGNASAQSAALAVTTATAPGEQVLLGEQQIAAANDGDEAGQAEAFRTTAMVSGDVTTVQLYLTAGTSLDIGVYADDGGHPRALLNQALVTDLTPNAWNAVTLPATAVTAGNNYWIAILGPSGTSALGFRDTQGGGQSETSASESLTTLPATWSTGTVYQDGQLSAYGTG